MWILDVFVHNAFMYTNIYLLEVFYILECVLVCILHLLVVSCILIDSTISLLDGGFGYLLFSPLFGKDSHFD